MGKTMAAVLVGVVAGLSGCGAFGPIEAHRADRIVVAPDAFPGAVAEAVEAICDFTADIDGWCPEVEIGDVGETWDDTDAIVVRRGLPLPEHPGWHAYAWADCLEVVLTDSVVRFNNDDRAIILAHEILHTANVQHVEGHAIMDAHLQDHRTLDAFDGPLERAYRNTPDVGRCDTRDML